MSIENNASSIRCRNPLRRNSVQNPGHDNASSDRHGLRISHNQRPDHRTHPLNLFSSLGRRLCLMLPSAVFFALLLVAKLHQTTDTELSNHGISEGATVVDMPVTITKAPEYELPLAAFKDAEGAETVVFLSGATIVDMPITMTKTPEYELPAAAFESHGATIVDMPVIITKDPGYELPAASFESHETAKESPAGSQSALQKAEDAVTSMLAKGFILGKDAVNKAKTLDEKHQLTSTVSAKVSSLDKKIGLTEKISIGRNIVGEKVREVDKKFQASEKTKSAFAAAEQTVSTAGSAIMKNRYISPGASWVAGAFNKVAQAADEVGQKTKEKVSMAEDEQKKKVGENQLTSTASAKVSSLDKKISLTEKISIGMSVVGEKVREVDQKFQVSERTKSGFAAAVQTVSTAGSAIIKNRYILNGALWVVDFNKVAQASGEVEQTTKEKVGMAEDEQKKKMVDDFTQFHLSELPKDEETSGKKKSEPVHDFIL